MDSLDKEYHDSDDLYCYYSDLPSPMAYHQNNIVNDCDILPKKEEIMNNLDKQYIELLQDIIDNGIRKEDRTDTGTISLFGKQIRHKMSEGFPLITTKKMFWKGIVTELVWFMMGNTNIKYLVDNNCHIWDGDAYKKYKKEVIDRNLWPFLVIDSGKPRPYTQEEFVNKIKIDDEFAKKWGELGPVYGKQWRSWNSIERVKYRSGDDGDETSNAYVDNGNIDQIANLINDLKTNPDSRRLMVNAWNVGEIDQMTLPPCHYGFQVYTRELSSDERVKLYEQKTNADTSFFPVLSETLDFHNIPTRTISLMWNQRSVDTFLGLPFNIASYGLLLEIIAKAVNMVPDELIGNLGDTHLYSNHIEQAKEQIGREPMELPKLNINTEFWLTEGGECGEGPLDAVAIFEGFKNDDFCRCLLEEDIQLCDYNSHATIKAPLSN